MISTATDGLKFLQMTEIEWLDNDQLALDIWNKKYKYKSESFEDWLDRVSKSDEHIKDLIRKKKFIFGGRILANRGIPDGSTSNCYSIGYVEDSLDNILKVNTQIALTYKAQGGQGLSLSKIRPKDTPIKDRYVSDGIVPFMEMFNMTTGSISVGRSRRGALLMSLDIWHKEAETFITIKSDLKKINNANLSVEIDDKFMDAIKTYYETKEIVRVPVEREYAGHVIKYEVIPIYLWKTLCEHACKYAEPGVIFTNKFRNYNLMQGHPKYRIETGNPCGIHCMA